MAPSPTSPPPNRWVCSAGLGTVPWDDCLHQTRKTSKLKGALTLQNAAGGTAERDWEFSATDAKTNSPSSLEIRFAEEDKLSFHWTTEGIATGCSETIQLRHQL